MRIAGKSQAVIGLSLATVAVMVTSACGSSSSSSDASQTKTLTKDGVSYQYPASWSEVTDLSTGSSTGNQQWQQAVGPTTTSLAILANYAVNVAVTPDNVNQLQSQIEQTISNLASQSQGTVTKPVTIEQTAGYPGFTAGVKAKTSSGTEVESTLWLWFNGKSEYFLNCQAVPNDVSQMLAGCNVIRTTFKVQ